MNSVNWASQEFLRKKLLETDEKKSLRQWAEVFEMAPSALSEVLNHKRPLSFKKAEFIAKNALGWTTQERKDFLSPFEQNQRIRKSQIKKAKPSPQKNVFKKLNTETFSLISNWEHFAILNLLSIKDFQPKTQWVANRLGLPIEQIEEACKRLESLQLLVRTPDKWSRGTRALSTLDDIPQEAVKRCHRSYLEHIDNALDFVDPKDREISGIVMAINSELLDVAKGLIRDFQNKMMDLLEQEGKQDSLFYLGTQLIPIGISKESMNREL